MITHINAETGEVIELDMTDEEYDVFLNGPREVPDANTI